MDIEITNRYDVSEQQHIESFKLLMDMPSIQQGLIKELGVYGYAVLSAIASYCDADGECFPSQKTIAAITGISERKVRDTINGLLDITVGGRPLLEKRVQSRPNKPNFNVYALYGFKEPQEVAEKVKSAEVLKEPVPKKKTAKDFIGYFMTKYKKCYGISYLPNYGRDGNVFKNKLMPKLTDAELLEVIDYTIDNYRDRWAKDKYLYPTVSMLGTWLGTTVIAELSDKREEDNKVKARIEQGQKVAATSYSSFDDI